MANGVHKHGVRVVEYFMRQFPCGPIIALCLAWAMPGAAFAQATAEPSVRTASIGQPVFEFFDRTHGLQSTALFEVRSDPHGFVWVGGDRGVHRFDGHTFFDLDRDPSDASTLESRYNYLLAPSHDGGWIIAPNGVVQFLDSQTGKLTRLAVHGAGQRDIEGLAADAQGRLWYLNPEGLIRVDRSGQAVRVHRPSLAMALTPDRTKVFVVERERLVAIDTRSAAASTALVLPKEFIGPVGHIVGDADGVWITVDDGLWRFDAKAGAATFVKLPVSLTVATGLVEADDGVLWFSEYEALYRYDPSKRTFSTFRHDPADPQSLRAGTIAGLAIDRSNNLWIAQGGAGLARLRLSQTEPSHYRLAGGLLICSVSEIDSRRLVMGLCPGGIVEIDRKTGQRRPLPASTPLPDRSRAIISDKAGGLWITSLREGLVHWRPDGSTNRYFLKGRENRHLLMSGVYVDRRNRVWVSQLRGLALLDEKAQELRSVGGDRFYIVNDVAGGPHDSLWLGTVNGLVNFQPDTGAIRRYEHDPLDVSSLSDNDVVQAYTDKDARLWVATRAGLNRLASFSNGRPVFKRYGLADGLPDITIASVTNDAQGNLWIGTYRGIARWNPQTDRFQSYLPADGIPDSDIYVKAMLHSADGNLYLGTWNGLWRIDPKTIRLADPVPVILSSYEVGDRETVNLQGGKLSRVRARYSDSRVVFRIAVLGDARRLSYRLAGLEDNWRDMPSDLTISYHRLPPGAYSLQIRQLQRDGTWGASDLTLPIDITPPFWRTGWAYLLYVLLAASLLFAAARAFVARKQRVLREQLKESNARLSVALQAAGFGMWAWDVKNGAAELDDQAREMLAVPDNAQPVEHVFARIHPDDLQRVRAQVDRALAENIAVNFEYRLADAADSTHWRWIEGHAMPYRRPGKTAYVIGVNRDATQRKQELLELEQSREEAQHATEAKGRFLAMMSHEIRTPINGVIGMVELLFETPMSQEQQQLLGICKDSAYMLLTIINDILDFSKIEAGKLKLEYTPFSPRRLIESIAESLRTQVAQKDIDMDVYVAPDVPRRLLGDRVRVRQILTNLVGNAVKFTEKGGVRVYVSASPAPNGNGHRHLVRFDVVDTGIGMDRRTLETLFQPFQQADAATTRRFGGTGLGLTIVKHLVELMGGQIECDSALSSGSRFSAVIPMESIPAEPKKDRDLRVQVLALCESRERAALLHALAKDIGAAMEIVDSVALLTQRIDEASSAASRLVLLDKGFADDHEALCRKIREQAPSLPILAVRADSRRAAPPSVPGVTVVAGSPLTGGSLVRGIRLALGLVSPPVPALAADSAATPLSEAATGETRILLAEDNATNREVITRQLQRLGYACDVAEDGEQAWHLLQANRDRYRLLLTDCHMPRLDGYGLTERIRRDEAATGRRRLNIVAITANALLGEGERCLALGMDAYLSKPLQMADLKRVLARMLPEASASGLIAAAAAPAGNASAEFGPLASIVGGDKAKLQRLLETFIRSTRNDLQQWARARLANEGTTLQQLAHKLKSGCRQIGEDTAAAAFEAVEQHQGTAAELNALADFALREMQRTLDKVESYCNRALEIRP